MEKYCCLFWGLLYSFKAWSSPWIGTLEPQLHQDLQVLVEWQVLDAAVTSYPVPWKGITQQLESLNVETLSDVPAIAAKRLKHYLQAHKKQSGQTIISLYGATETSRFTEFNGSQTEEVQLNVSKEFYAGRWAAQISTNHLKAGEHHFDQSFLAYQFGNWNLRVGALDQWWGPAQSSSLIMSNNARPIPSISVSRSEATRSKNSWLKHIGPWFFTAQIGQLESQRAVPDARLWSTRFNFTPILGLEIGISWSAMWGGEGQANDIGDWFKVVTFQTECANGEATCDDALDTKLGNHIAGFDFKYSMMLFGQPFSIYGQRVGEDAVDYYRVTDNANLLGLSTYILDSKVYIEASDTNVACDNSGLDVKNCYYEHGTYQSGYRHYDRAIGSTFDSDVKMLSVGMNKAFSNGDLFEIVANRLTLNEDQTRPSPVLKGLSEELYRLSGFYQTQYSDWLIKLGASIEHGEVDEAESDTNTMVYAEIKYRLN